jgi:hypothetical protein
MINNKILMSILINNKIKMNNYNKDIQFQNQLN